jgi:hypothetical protein
MQVFLFLALLVVVKANAQPVAMLDKEWKEPIALAMPLAEPIDYHFFPVYKADIDSVIILTEWFIELLGQKEEAQTLNQIKNAGASKFIAFTNQKGSLIRFQLNLITRCGQAGYKMELVNLNDGHKQRLQKLRAFLAYLRNNRFLLDEAPL